MEDWKGYSGWNLGVKVQWEENAKEGMKEVEIAVSPYGNGGVGDETDKALLTAASSCFLCHHMTPP